MNGDETVDVKEVDVENAEYERSRLQVRADGPAAQQESRRTEQDGSEGVEGMLFWKLAHSTATSNTRRQLMHCLTSQLV